MSSYLKLGETSSALKDANKASQLEPENPNVNILRGRIFVTQGKAALAIAEFRRALNLNPELDAIAIELKNLEASQ